MFKHNIYGDQPKFLNDMPDSSNLFPLEFFLNPRCPSALAAIEATKTEVDKNEVAGREKELKRRRGVLLLGILMEHLNEPHMATRIHIFYGTIDAIGVFWKFSEI